MSIGAKIDRARVKVARSAPKFMADLCTIEVKGDITNANDGTFTEGLSSVEDVPCDLEPMSAYERLTGGGNLGGYADYKLTLPYFWEDSALLVPANASVTVAARGVNPQRTLTVIGPLYSSTDLFLTVAAKLEG